MNDKNIYPLLFIPALKDYIWGGRNLERLGRKLPEGITAESWEIAAHEDGQSVVENGPLAGKTLGEVHAELGLDLIGTHSTWAQERGKFPLLVKLLDANRPLSVQVHPNDDYALVHEGNELGKSEMWVVLHAEPGAELIIGVKNGTTRESFHAALEAGKLEDCLHHLPIKTGDHVCVPAGTLHAIMDGLLITEIQQNSNTTYRVYDWKRLGADGKPRPLHVEKSLDVINFEIVEPEICPPALVAEGQGVRRFELCRNRYFVTERVKLSPGAVYRGECDGKSLEIWGAIEGMVGIGELTLEPVRFVLLPAALGPFNVRAGEQGAVVLRTYVA